jgi:chemotaxis protein methyltransferase CheR
MIFSPGVDDIVRFRAQIVEIMGLYFDESKFATLAQILHNRMLANGFDHHQYLSWLNTNSSEEIRLLARELTVTETYFLRNIDQFNAFAEIALPQRLAFYDDNRKINVLSAACASGEEPYSMAITVHEHCAYASDRISITAFDLNPAMLQKAKRARYSTWSLRELSSELKNRWFKPDGDAFMLNDKVRNEVEFESRNLTQDALDFWSPGRFDIVFCRNVLMYFSNEQAQAAVDRIARSMAPGGYLFLGHAETLRGLSNDFHLCHSHDTFYYQRKEHITPSFIVQPQLQRWQPTASLTNDTSWIQAIQRASDRIHAIHASSPTPVAEPVTLETTSYIGESIAPDLYRVFESFQHDMTTLSPNLSPASGREGRNEPLRDFNVNEDSSLNLPPQHAHDPDDLLLKAVSLIHSGTLAAAEVTCEELLERDELNAGAHYVLALCRESAGDLDGAAVHDQTAAYLDPEFAMPRLHLGLLLRRKGERESARGHLEQAMLLLQQEDASRLLLFGGGFKREALIALCRAEFTALGEK